MYTPFFRWRSITPSVVLLGLLFIFLLFSELFRRTTLTDSVLVTPGEFEELRPEANSIEIEEWASSRFLKGAPTQNFRDNLLDDVHYITGWSLAGFTNQFMCYVHLIYVGMLSDRVPIIPPFGPDHHISYDAGTLPFGRVYNLSRARQALKKPLLEWIDVKEIPDPFSLKPPLPSEREQLGCWSGRHESEPRPSRVNSVVDNLRLDIAYTRIPTESRWRPYDVNEDFLDFSHVVPYIFPNNPINPPGSLPLLEVSPLGHQVFPNTKMACFDHLYYMTSSHEKFEWRFSWSPAWRYVAQHLYFTDELVNLAKAYLAKSFKTTLDDIPPFIAVHMRRGDFKRQCNDGTPEDRCLIPLSRFQKHVDKIREEIKQKQYRVVKEVVVMSDEKDPNFWKEIERIGWTHLDHVKELTLETYGEWIPPILDQVAQSLAAGFVGTDDSTFSLVSMRRIQDWNHGPGVMIQKGNSYKD